MKKMMMIAAMMVATVAAKAQFEPGTFTLQPKVGFVLSEISDKEAKFKPGMVAGIEGQYQINNWFGLSAAALYTQEGSKIKNSNGKYYAGSQNFDTFDGNLEDVNRNAFTINPYVRYKFAKTGDFTFFVDGGFSYTMIHYSNTSLATYDDNANQWALGFKPGISYSLTDKVSLVAHVGDLGYAFYKWGDQKSNTFDMGISNNISFGAYVSF